MHTSFKDVMYFYKKKKNEANLIYSKRADGFPPKCHNCGKCI